MAGKWIAEIHQGLKHLHRGMMVDGKRRHLALGMWGMTTSTIYINSSTGQVLTDLCTMLVDKHAGLTDDKLGFYFQTIGYFILTVSS